jgi:uncharacterized protein DUF397
MFNESMPVFERGVFRKASRSGQNPQACVEVARGNGWVVIRDSKQQWHSEEDHRLVFTAEQFDAWLAAQSAEATDTVCIEIARHADDDNVFRSTVPQEHDKTLTFTDAEIEAFLDGARKGEFAMNTFTELAAATNLAAA